MPLWNGGPRTGHTAFSGPFTGKRSGGSAEKMLLVLRYVLYFILFGLIIDLMLFLLFVWTGDLLLATLPFSQMVIGGISFILVRMVRDLMKDV